MLLKSIKNLSFISLLVLLGLSTSFAQNRPLSDLTSGDYPALASVLGKISYQPETLHKLSRASLVWIDKKWFAEKGYDVPDRITESFEREILEALAYASRIGKEPKNAYTDETKTFYSDYYGGDGLGHNRGSGRAASKNEIQIKGVGQTKMVHYYMRRSDYEHSSGFVGLEEGINEAIASQIAHNEMPFGANRVIAIIATGTKIKGEPRVLIIREDPLRPAHFIENSFMSEVQREQERVKFVMSKLSDILPLSPEQKNLDTKEKIEAGLVEIIDRHAKIAAYSYTNHFLHSAFSPSNIELDGATLDFGAFMTLDGYPQAGRPKDNELNGNTVAFEAVLKEFLQSIRNQAPGSLKQAFPKVNDSLKLFRARYLSYLRSDMMEMTGAPPELLSQLQNKPAFHDFADFLLVMSHEGNDKIYDALNETLQDSGTYKMDRIFIKAATVVGGIINLDLKTQTELDLALQKEIPLEGVRQVFVIGYLRLLKDLKMEADKIRIPFSNLARYMQLAAPIKNKKILPLMNKDGIARTDWAQLIKDFKADRDPKRIRYAIQDAIQNFRRTYHDQRPYSLVLNERSVNGGIEREVFDLKTGAYQVEAQASKLTPKKYYLPYRCGDLFH